MTSRNGNRIRLVPVFLWTKIKPQEQRTLAVFLYLKNPLSDMAEIIAVYLGTVALGRRVFSPVLQAGRFYS